MSKAQFWAELSFHAHLPGPLFEEPGSSLSHTTKVCPSTSAKFKALSTFLLVSFMFLERDSRTVYWP